MRQIGKVVALAAFLGVFLGISFFGPSKDMPFSQVVITYAFQYYQFGYTDIVYITTRMLPYLLFLFLFGTYIYKHFCTAGVYVFSRCENRLKWIAKEIAQLFGFCVLFTVLIPLFGMALACMTNHVTFGKADIYIYFYYVAIYALWLFFVTLLANMLAIRFGGMKGFGLVVIGICVCIALLSLWDGKKIFSLTVEDMEAAKRHAIYLKCNPISHLFISWHSSSDEMVSQYINILEIDFNLMFSVVVMAVASAITAIVSMIYIKKVDLIIMLGREEN